MPLLLLLLVIPLIEIALFIEVGGEIGVWPTIAIVILTAVAGAYILRRHSLTALRDVQSRLAAGESPERMLADAAMILVAGILLLVPGFLSDTMGVLLLVPPLRGWLFKRMTARIAVVTAGDARARPRGPGGGGPGGGWPGGETVEGEFEEIDPEARHERDADHQGDAYPPIEEDRR